MNDIPRHRRHRFNALFTLLTGRGAAPPPRNPHLLRDVGLSEPAAPNQPSRITLMALAHRAIR